MTLNDQSVLRVEMVEVDEADERSAGVVITTQHAEILISEDELKALLKWCKTGTPPK